MGRVLLDGSGHTPWTRRRRWSIVSRALDAGPSLAVLDMVTFMTLDEGAPSVSQVSAFAAAETLEAEGRLLERDRRL